jgi:hypothetical protein
MLFDAVIGHALLWDNDPYWTYWVTDTFLIATVFSVGTPLIGAGIARGAVITVVQMLVLTTYYWSLSPIGLPSNPEWLDLEHTWLTGPPVHFGVYYLGYLVALWLWLWLRRAVAGDVVRSEVATDVVRALVTAGGIVAVVGAAQTVALDEFPGVTWLVMRIVILVPFTLGWWALAGRDRAASVSGGRPRRPSPRPWTAGSTVAFAPIASRRRQLPAHRAARERRATEAHRRSRATHLYAGCARPGARSDVGAVADALPARRHRRRPRERAAGTLVGRPRSERPEPRNDPVRAPSRSPRRARGAQDRREQGRAASAAVGGGDAA